LQIPKKIDKPNTSNTQAITSNITSQQNLYHPKVFITYASNDKELKSNVIAIAQLLSNQGLQIIMDVSDHREIQTLGVTTWTTKQIENCDFTLIVCTQGYLKDSIGIVVERYLINPELRDTHINKKFIPIFIGEVNRNFVPTLLRDLKFYLLPKDKEELIRLIYDKPEIVFTVGPIPDLKTATAQENLKPLTNYKLNNGNTNGHTNGNANGNYSSN